MRNRYHLVFQQTQRKEAAFTIGLAVILGGERNSLKYLRRIHKIDAVLTQIRSSLGFIPREHETL
jgi:hypothetical protein